MKKFFYILFVSILFFSCCKKEEMVTINFQKQMITSNSMTRVGNDFIDVIDQHTSNYLNVTLKNKDLGTTYTCKSNESITIPVGNYTIYAEYKPSDIYYSYNECRMYKEPSIYVESFDIKITTIVDIITLNAYYNCYAIFSLIDECKNVKCQYAIWSDEKDLPKVNKYYVAYFTGNVIVKLTPYDDSMDFITTEYNFSTIYDINKVYAEHGKYYVIHPNAVSKTSSSFNVDLTKMTEGTL